MILAGENRSTRRKTCSIAISFTNLSWAGPGVEPGPPWREDVDKQPDRWHDLWVTEVILNFI